jgi:hypothetical protein
MVHHTVDQRVAALVANAKAGGVISDAVTRFNDWLHEDEKQLFSRSDQFIRDTQKKWDKHRTVQDLYAARPPSHAKVVPDEVARQCAAALKGGYIKRVCVDQDENTCHVHKVHRYYTSINEACCNNDVLASAIERYAVTPQHLLRRMHQVDPSLCQRVVEFKWLLSEAQKAERQTVACRLFTSWQANKKLLLGVWWIDETAIWIIKSANAKQCVWADAHDQGVRAVLSNPHVLAHEDIKCHCMGATNALLGPCFFEFTTGTTDILRFNTRAEGDYMVGAAL